MWTNVNTFKNTTFSFEWYGQFINGQIYSQVNWDCSNFLAPVISLENVLRLLQHLHQFKELFSEANIIPRQHYMLHLRSQIIYLGTLIRCMCMWFEAKHSYFKQWASKLNLKNVCKSLAVPWMLLKWNRHWASNFF